MVKAFLIAAWVLCLFGFAAADQICMRTQTNGDTWIYNPVPFSPSWSEISWTPNHHKWVKDGGTNCAMRVKAWVNNYGWKYAFIDMGASSNWKNTEYGQAYVSQQRVHEHTDSCFEMQAGFGNVNLDKNIEIEFVEGSCDDAAWIDRFFVPGRKSWGVTNHIGWCFNGKKNLAPLNAWDPLFGDGSNKFESYNDPLSKVVFNDGCARKWILKPDGNVYAGQWGSSSGTGSRSGRRALKALPTQNGRFEGLQESERNEISLIEDLYDICESYNSGRKSDRYETETAQIVRSCFAMLEPFYKTYLEFQNKEDNAIPEKMRFASDTMEERKEDKESEEESIASKINRELKLVQRLIQEEQKDQDKDAVADTKA